MRPTTMLESMPPLRKAPTGTSATMWRCTAASRVSNRSAFCSAMSASPRPACPSRPMFQYTSALSAPPR